MRYRKKPLVVEAVRYRNDLIYPMDGWVEKALDSGVLRRDEYNNAVVKTLEGDMTVANGDYIIKGVQGEIYPCKPEIFERTYERVE